MPAGYSPRSLVEKLGIKPGSKIAILNAPRGYRTMLGKLPAGVRVATTLQGKISFIQLFTVARAELEQRIPGLGVQEVPRKGWDVRGPALERREAHLGGGNAPGLCWSSLDQTRSDVGGLVDSLAVDLIEEGGS